MIADNSIAIAFLDMGRPRKRHDERPSIYPQVVEAALANALSLVVRTPELDRAVEALRDEARQYAAIVSTGHEEGRPHKVARARLTIAFDDVAFHMRNCAKSPRALLEGL